MELFELLEEIRDREGLSPREFADRLDIDPSTWYKWRDGTSTPSRAVQRAAETEFSVRIEKIAKGSYKYIDIGSRTTDIPASGTEGEEATASDTEERMIGQYECLARKAGLPHWEDLNEYMRAELRAIYYLSEAAQEKARREAEMSAIQAIQQQQRQQRQ
jgi:transcriptional regulator with XRE-family HTH domain